MWLRLHVVLPLGVTAGCLGRMKVRRLLFSIISQNTTVSIEVVTVALFISH